MPVTVMAQNITAKVYRQTGTTGKAYGKMHIPQGKKYKVAIHPQSGVTVAVLRAHIDGQNIYLSTLDPYGETFWIDASEVEQNFLVRSSDGTDVVAVPVTADEETMMVEKRWFFYDASDARRNSLKYTSSVIANETLRESKTFAARPIYVMANPAKYGLAFVWLDQNTTTKDLPAGSLYVLGKVGSRGRQLNIVFEDEVDSESSGINDVRTSGRRQADDALYNLQGVRVEKPVKGSLYIRNGRKYVAE